MLFVQMDITAEPRTTTAKIQNITNLAIILLGFSVKLTDGQRSAAVDEVRQRAAPINLLVEVEHELTAVKDSILEVVDEMNSVKITCIDTELTEHAVAKIILIIIQHFLLTTRLQDLLPYAP